jgi:hypothetical protein
MLYPDDEEPLPLKGSGKGAVMVGFIAFIALCIASVSALSHLPKIDVAAHPSLLRSTAR